MISLNRADVCAVSGLTESQLSHLIKISALAADVGGQRKRFSVLETRMATIASAALETGTSAQSLVEPLNWLRDAVIYPEFVSQHDDPIEILLATEIRKWVNIYKNTDLSQELTVEWLSYDLFAKEYCSEQFLERRLDSQEIFVDFVARKDEIERAGWIERLESEYKERAKTICENGTVIEMEEFQKAETALDFELASKGIRSCFFQYSCKGDSWRTLLSRKVEPIEGYASWVTIDLTSLFRTRPIDG